jgi:hypothetical protein
VNKLVKGMALGVMGVATFFLTGCATMPGGIAASSTPLEGRSYQILGYTAATDSSVKLLGFIPISGGNHIRDAVRSAARKAGGDALIEVTVEAYDQYWILFSRHITRVDGIAIRFTK